LFTICCALAITSETRDGVSFDVGFISGCFILVCVISVDFGISGVVVSVGVKIIGAGLGSISTALLTGSGLSTAAFGVGLFAKHVPHEEEDSGLDASQHKHFHEPDCVAFAEFVFKVPLLASENSKPVNVVRVTPVQVNTPQPQTYPEVQGNFVIGSQFISEAEIVNETDSPFLLSIVRGFNSAYRFGFLLSYVTLLLLSFVAAPFFGMFIGFLEIVCQAVRAIVRPFGKIVADSLGYGTLINSQTFRNERELENLALKNV